jgi:hypothetical protein
MRVWRVVMLTCAMLVASNCGGRSDNDPKVVGIDPYLPVGDRLFRSFQVCAEKDGFSMDGKSKLNEIFPLASKSESPVNAMKMRYSELGRDELERNAKRFGYEAGQVSRLLGEASNPSVKVFPISLVFRNPQVPIAAAYIGTMISRWSDEQRETLLQESEPQGIDRFLERKEGQLVLRQPRPNEIERFISAMVRARRGKNETPQVNDLFADFQYGFITAVGEQDEAKRVPQYPTCR